MFRNVLGWLRWFPFPVEVGYRLKIWPYFARIPFFGGRFLFRLVWGIVFFASTLFGWGQWNVQNPQQKMVVRFRFRPLNSYVEPCCHNHLATWISYFVAKMDLTIDPLEDHHLENPCHHSFRWATMQSWDFSDFSPFFLPTSVTRTSAYRFNCSSLSLFCIDFFVLYFYIPFNGNFNSSLCFGPHVNLYHTCDMTHSRNVAANVIHALPHISTSRLDFNKDGYIAPRLILQ